MRPPGDHDGRQARHFPFHSPIFVNVIGVFMQVFRRGRAYRDRRIRVPVRRVPMTALSAYRRSAHALIGAALALAATASIPAGATETIKVVLDQAAITRLPEHVSTIVIGNPLIADVTVQPGGVLIVTGKGYGTTNLIALDRAGKVLTERNIEVVGPEGNVVVVYRGVNRESYSCAPECERRITLGDTPEYFNATLLQAGDRAARAQGQGAAPGH
jgi:hypothetical protein